MAAHSLNGVKLKIALNTSPSAFFMDDLTPPYHTAHAYIKSGSVIYLPLKIRGIC